MTTYKPKILTVGQLSEVNEILKDIHEGPIESPREEKHAFLAYRRALADGALSLTSSIVAGFSVVIAVQAVILAQPPSDNGSAWTTWLAYASTAVAMLLAVGLTFKTRLHRRANDMAAAVVAYREQFPASEPKKSRLRWLVRLVRVSSHN